MSERQETHAAVIAEMRESDNEAVCPWWADGGDCVHCPMGGAGKNCPFDKFADRLEAARKREATAEKSSVVGNAAKMREALVRTDSFLSALGKWLKVNDEGQEYALAAGVIHTLVSHALAALPRNCDMGTEHEQYERFERYCDNFGRYFDGEPKCNDCPLWMHVFKEGGKCEFSWAQMPCEGETDGSK